MGAVTYRYLFQPELLVSPLLSVGVPISVVASLALVTLLPIVSLSTSTPPTPSASPTLSIEGLGFKLVGPAAQIVLWAMCFILILGGSVAAKAAERPRPPENKAG
jgi:hypothetical protein